MTDTSTLDTIRIRELFRLLPHRYPFLLIDRIIDMEDDTRATGIKNVTFNEPHFNGHFPGEPIMPGVLIIEAMAQTCGAIVANRHSKGQRKLVYFMTIDGAKFRKPVIPGDVLRIDVIKLKQRGNIFRYDCTAHVEAHRVAEAVISAMMVDPEGNS
ncbi:MAG: 3-hydroxyacyl-[acyl-carrier-protein] dehydratase FabZ [Alphaproteobacteria bacterium]|nr:MAG: 3-hydroxyacyl-[acyl-carrier-protein] dehydratase FabZ [Alphaproteobacteria bacterium]